MTNDLDTPRWPAVIIAGSYLLVGALWILFSDQVLLHLVQDRERLSQIQTYKGWLYVVVTAGLVFLLVRGYAKRIQASRAHLLESRRSIETLMSNLPGMAYRCSNDESWTMEFVSEGSRELTGYEPGELIQNRVCAFADLILPEDRASVWSEVQNALVQTRPFQLMYRIVNKSGVEKWVWEQGTAVRSDTGVVEALEGFITDITVEKRAQQDLALRMREITAVHDVCRRVNEELTMDQTAAAGLDGVFAAVNPDLSLLFLRNGSDLILRKARGRTPRHKHEETPIHVVGECLCGLAASENKPMYALNIYEDPRCIWNECKKSGMRSFAALPLRVGEEVIGVLGLASEAERDFERQAAFLETIANEIALGTHNALLFERIRNHEAELEREVERRTAELRSANEELEAFAYSVSHDLRAPVRHIDGFARMMLDQERQGISSEGLRLLEVIRNSAQRMGILIDDLLLLSRIGRKALEKRKVDCTALVREVWRETAASDEKTQAKFDLEPLPEAYADFKLVRQVWANLLGNAIKYSSTRPDPEIVVDSYVSEGNMWYRVRDNGVGFDPRYANKLFTVFQRLHREDEFPGTGVGLAIAARIVQKHGGQIRAFGQLGQGATFEFTLGGGDTACS